MPADRTQSKVLMLSANALVRDNVRVLLGSMGLQCLVASNLKEALLVLEQEKPYAAIVDPYQADSSPAGIVAAFYRMVPGLRERLIVLTAETSDPELLCVLDAYSLPQVPVDRLLQGLWPRLDSLLGQNFVTQKATGPPRLVYDSLLQPSTAGIRSSQLSDRRFLYESASLMVDLSLERQRDSQRIALVGQVVNSAHPDHELDRVPIVLQGHGGLIGVVATNEFGEFHFDFDSEPGVTLDIGVKGKPPVSIELANLKDATRGTAGETRLPEAAGDFNEQRDMVPRRSKRR